MFCEKCGVEVDVVDVHEAKGFTGATIVFYDLSCGHQVLDDSDDTLEAVR